MTDEPNTTFRRGVVRPIECYRQGWELIKETYWLFLGITLVAMLIAQFGPFGILVGPCMCGLYLCFFRMMDGNKPPFELLFKGFDHFVQGLIATLLMMVPAFILMIPAMVAFVVIIITAMPTPKPNAPPDGEFLWVIFAAYFGFLLVIMFLSALLHIFFLFTFPLIVDRGLTGPLAVVTSAKAGIANFGGILLLVLLNFVLGMLGLFACYIGAIFVLPITYAANAVAFRAVFPKDVVTDPTGDLGDDITPEPPVNGV